jgi:hypothetical protein
VRKLCPSMDAQADLADHRAFDLDAFRPADHG